MTSVVVTGAARGIGRAIAERMVAQGHRVVITDVSPDVAEVAAVIGAAAGVVHDVRDAASHHAVAELATGHGDLVAWFNNAGVGHDGLLAELSDEQVRALVEVNLLGVLWGTRAAFGAFGPGGGDVVNTASLSGLGPVPGLSVYAATKAAVVSLTMSTAIEAGQSYDAVRVHAVLPDGVATEMVAAMSNGLGKQLVHSGGRLLTVDEIAEAAVGLVGSTRILRTVPPWRGAVMRTTALLPSVAARGIGIFAAQGKKRL